MKIFKPISIILGVLVLIAVIFFGFQMGKKYKRNQSLNNSALGREITPSDREETKLLENGQIHSKQLIELKEIAPVWDKLSERDNFKKEYAYLNNLNFYAITYKSDTLLINGILAEPKKAGKYPVIIFNRGGNKEIGKIAKAKTLFTLIFSASKVAEQGYVILASCYREQDEFGGSDINDVLNLIKTASQLESVDTTRIGMFGWSRGGMMTYLALKKSTVIKTAVIGNGPTDLAALIEDRPEMETEVFAKLVPNYTENKEEELKKRSVVYWADELDTNSSLLILCGTEDKRVNPNQADKIAGKLKAINYDFKLRKFETDHSFTTKTEELNKLLIAWFSERL